MFSEYNLIFDLFCDINSKKPIDISRSQITEGQSNTGIYIYTAKYETRVANTRVATKILEKRTTKTNEIHFANQIKNLQKLKLEEGNLFPKIYRICDHGGCYSIFMQYIDFQLRNLRKYSYEELAEILVSALNMFRNMKIVPLVDVDAKSLLFERREKMPSLAKLFSGTGLYDRVKITTECSTVMEAADSILSDYPMVLSHGDLHIHNWLISEDRSLKLIDWEVIRFDTMGTDFYHFFRRALSDHNGYLSKMSFYNLLISKYSKATGFSENVLHVGAQYYSLYRAYLYTDYILRSGNDDELINHVQQIEKIKINLASSVIRYYRSSAVAY